MRLLLHILTRPDDALAREIITEQKRDEENQTIVADLTQAQPDYKALLENIFEADSVQTW
ncbi:MAG: hypothetical protein ABSA83_03695 [Verrucomicrobiota bacterium]|jgi:hypothetical protein